MTKTMTFDALYQQLIDADAPGEVFGDLAKMTEQELKRQFREMAQIVHPDHHMTDKAVAEHAFKLLQSWYQAALSRVGQSPDTIVIKSAKATYRTTAVYQHGDLADLYRAKGGKTAVLLKIGRQPKNNDLMQAEASALRKIGRALDGDPLRAHFPTLVDSFKMQDAARKERYVNVLAFEKEYITVADVIKAYPNGIDAADAAWMYNRMLAALGKTHALGLVHGAVLPAHMLLRLKDHNGILIDWCYAVNHGQPIKAISPAYKAHYPPEVFAKQPTTEATDIYMATVTLLQLLGGNVETKEIPNSVPKPIAALIRSCLIESPHRRPTSAWEVFDNFHEILGRLYGAPKFRPFSL